MTAVYIKEQGAQVGRSGERLVVKKRSRVIDEIPMAKIDKLVVMGNVNMTTPALTAMVDRDIRVVYLTSRGRYRMHTEKEGSSHAALRRQQYQAFGQDSVRLGIAKGMVLGKITNQRTILQRQTRRQTPLDRRLFKQGLEGMQAMQRQLARARSLNELRGYEGRASAWYFKAVRSFLTAAWGFQERQYYPAPDPFNALLSFAYSLVTKDVLAAVHVVGLDPGLGFFHEVRSARPSLALDLVEEWRPVIADALVLQLVNARLIAPEEFVRTNNARRPVELGDAGVEKVLRAYETRLDSKQFHPMAGPGGETDMRQIMMLQARQIAQIVAGDRQQFEPFVIR